MRYITVSQLQEGMVLAWPLLGSSLRVMLGDGTALERQHIDKISESGYGGVYIRDDQDTNVSDVVSFETRVRTIGFAKEIITSAESGSYKTGTRMTRQQQDKMINPVMDEVIESRKRMMDYIDLKPFEDYTYYHTANVMILSVLVGVELGLSGTRLYELGLSSLLYDLGNIFVPKSILNKPGKLSPEEYNIIKQHTQMGFDHLRENFDISIEGCMGALQHHENYDGTGYPNGLRKDKISIYGRIIAITDVFDALTSRRSFRPAMYPATAMDFVDMNSGTMFDPEVVKALKNVVASYPSGVCVEMSSGVQALVMDNTPGFGQRPKVKMLNQLSKTPLVVDLATNQLFSGVSVSHIME